MNFEALEILADIVRVGSLSAVARERRLTPSTISRLIAGLESELGTRLLQRTTRRVTPTEAALTLLEHAQPHLDGLRNAQDAVLDATSGEPRGLLRVTASTSFGVFRLSPLTAEFCRRYPDIRLEMFLSDAIVDIVAQRFDLAIRHGGLPDSSLIAQRLIRTRYFVCASPAYLAQHGQPREPAELSRHRCLIFPTPSAVWRFKHRKGRIEQIPIAASVVVNSALVLRECALDAGGLVLLADWLITDDLRAGRLIDVFPHLKASPTHFDTTISAVYPSRAHLPRKVSAFIEFLKQQLRAT